MQRYFVKNINDKRVIFEDSDIHHIKNVMRMNVNDVVEVVFNNLVYRASIECLDPLIVNTIEEVKSNKINKPDVIMIIPLVIEQKMDYILQKGTELGVSEFYIYDAVRSKIKLDNEKYLKKVNRWSKICKEASEQSHRVDIPLIKGIYKLSDLKNCSGLKIVCSTNNVENFKNILKKNLNCDKINIVVGPEGGLDPKEEEKLVSFDYLRVSLGPNVLRVETAPLCVLSYINYEFME